MKELADQFNQEIVTAFKDKYPIVAEPGPSVARIRIAITNIKQSRPGVSVVTSIIPVGMGVSLVKKGATGGWSGSGETGIEVMALDSMTNDILILALDQEESRVRAEILEMGFGHGRLQVLGSKGRHVYRQCRGRQESTQEIRFLLFRGDP